MIRIAAITLTSDSATPFFFLIALFSLRFSGFLCVSQILSMPMWSQLETVSDLRDAFRCFPHISFEGEPMGKKNPSQDVVKGRELALSAVSALGIFEYFWLC